MNKLKKFVKRLKDQGLSDRQVDEAVFALNEYLNELRQEERQAEGYRYRPVTFVDWDAPTQADTGERDEVFP